MDKSTKHLPRESLGDSYNSVFTEIPRLGLGNTYRVNEKTKMILPFVLDAASAIFWNVSKKEPKLAVAPLEIKKNNQTFNIIQSLIYQRKGKLF